MTIKNNYSKTAACLLDAEEATILRPRRSEFLPPDEIAEQLQARLAQPTNYPPLSEVTVPGDTVVLAIEPGIPQQLPVLEGVLKSLRAAGVEESLVTLLLASSSEKSDTLQDDLAELGYSHCHVKIHNPEDEKEMAFLGVTQAGLALRLNRLLCEADLVLPVTVAKGELMPDSNLPTFAGLFPLFSDRETSERLSAANTESFPSIASESVSEIKDCVRLLGVGISIHVLPTSGGQVAALFAGDPSTIARQSEEAYRKIWQVDSPLHGNLVVATLAGGAEQQTWQNVGRALVAAEAVVEPDGCIVIYSELAEPPGLALSQLFDNADSDVTRREIQQNPGPDSQPAMQLCQTLERHTVYLRSQLSPAVVENLGITPLESDSELEQLAQALRPCVVLEEAQRLLPSVVEVEA